MKPRRHIVLYVIASVWNLTICWPVVLLIHRLWGENLHWETNPDPTKGDAPSLWTSLRPNSWPARSWYRKKAVDPETGRKRLVELPDYAQARYGRWRTWGATTLGHGGFTGPGVLETGKWLPIQEHEHKHVEQFEAAMLRAFMVSIFVVLTRWEFQASDVAQWWLGYVWMGVAGWLTAWLRGEDPYRGSHHEEAAYDTDTTYGASDA